MYNMIRGFEERFLMKKILITSLIIMLLSQLLIFSVGAENDLNQTFMKDNIGSYVFVIVNDEIVTFNDVRPIINSGWTYVPIRRFAESLGANVSWDSKENQVTVEKEGKLLVLDYNSKSIVKDGIKIEIPLLSHNNRILAPYRFIGEFFGYDVSYFSEGPIARVKDCSAVIPDAEIVETFKYEINELKKEIIENLRKNQRVVYLTFDDGPNRHTSNILDLLKKYDMKATFFLLNNNMRAFPSVVNRIANDGHAIGLHGVTHNVDLVYKTDTSVLEEMNITNSTLKSITGSGSRLIRVPYGSHPHLTRNQYNHLKNSGYKMWDWNVDSGDSRVGATSKRIANHVISSLTNEKNDIILFHDIMITVNALEEILIWMRLNNITSKPLTEDMTPYNWQKYR